MLDPRPGDFIIDGTVDGGGHAEAILGHIAPSGKLLGLDWDATMLADCRARLAGANDATLILGNYADLPSIIKREKCGKANGLLLDLGFSSEQILRSGRGFSFSEASRNEPLLMTYDDAQVPARDLIAAISKRSLPT